MINIDELWELKEMWLKDHEIEDAKKAKFLKDQWGLFWSWLREYQKKLKTNKKQNG